MGDYRRATMGINFKLQKRNLKDLAWNNFVLGEGKMKQKNVPTIIVGENIKPFKYYTNYDFHYFPVLK